MKRTNIVNYLDSMLSLLSENNDLDKVALMLNDLFDAINNIATVSSKEAQFISFLKENKIVTRKFVEENKNKDIFSKLFVKFIKSQQAKAIAEKNHSSSRDSRSSCFSPSRGRGC